MTYDDWLKLDLPMRWSIYRSDRERAGFSSWDLDLRTSAPDGEHPVVYGAGGRKHEPVRGIRVVDGAFDPESTAEACYRAVCEGFYGMPREHTNRPAIDHVFIESLRWDRDRGVFVLQTGS